ncbi:MAG: hypothetical protein COB93_11390 [Sneathiella sp.]|nr:MAG: hypothetical protein COB93_11390 [Sneathiella sp.]
MGPTRNFFLLLWLQLGVYGCSSVDDTLLNRQIQSFSSGTVALAAVIQNDFELAEKANSMAFTDNLQFQLELGGNPETTLKPLFSRTDIAARWDLLAAMSGYVETLSLIATGKAVPSTFASVSSVINGLKSLDYRQFDLTHSLSILDTQALISDISIFQELFILPARDKKLAAIIQAGDAAVKKTAMLLYIDIGEVQDQSGTCSYSVPANDTDQSISSLRLCRGGLRAIVDTAIKSDVDTWKGKLALLKNQNGVGGTGVSSTIIQKLVAAQKLGQLLDQTLIETQAALVAMVGAHGDIVDTLNPENGVAFATPVLNSRSGIFLQKVIMAKAIVQSAEDALATLSQAPTITSILSNSGGQNDK